MHASQANPLLPDTAGLMAVVDLGSNSFQMLFAEMLNGRVVEIARFREKVQLAGGLDAANRLEAPVLAKAYRCLQAFAEQLKGIAAENILVVGTDALRRATNQAEFLARAKQILPVPVAVISGDEEAQLIYQGVIANVEQPDLMNLVLDIGGGSTELAMGRGDALDATASIAVGCVDIKRAYFPESRTSLDQFKASVAAIVERLTQLPQHIKVGHWQQAIGTSGTILAIEQVVVENGWCPKGISRESLQQLVQRLCVDQPLAELELRGVSEDRLDIFIAGVAITYALFEALNLAYLKTSEQSLKEGLVCRLYQQRHA